MSEITVDLDFGPLPVPPMAGPIPLGGVTAITGRSGAGKTTLLRAIAGLERSAAGRVVIAGEDWSDRPAWRRPVGLVFQEARLFRHLDVAGNIGFGAARRGIGPGRVAEIVDLLALAPLLRRRVTTLSGGEARRVALARALASGPELLLLDEPLTGLDAPRREELLGILGTALRETGIPALLVTHDPREIAALAHEVVAIGTEGLSAAPPPDRIEGRIEGGLLHLTGHPPLDWRGRCRSGSVRLWLDRSVAPRVAADPGEGDHVAAVPSSHGIGRSAGEAGVRLLLPRSELP